MRIKTDIPLTLSVIGKILGIPTDSDIEINAITTHSALCEKNDLFIALKGGRLDGAKFTGEARKRGAFILSENDNADFKVKCSAEALLDIACAYKEIINPLYTVAITGSIGKTTVKDFVSALLSGAMRTHKTEGNYNNIIGVSYTLLSMPKNAKAVVCEMGMNHRGELDVISRRVKPDVAAITNVGTAHIGNLGSREEIAKAKLEIQNGMTNGKTVVFKEEALLSGAHDRYTLSYTDRSADLFAQIISRGYNGSEIYVKTKSFERAFHSPLFSMHTLDSLLISIGICDIIGIESDTIYDGVGKISADSLRQRFINKNGYRIYDDSYNSSAEAVIADFKMLEEFGGENSAVIGDMLELGEKSLELHRYIGSECARHAFKKLYAFGEFADAVADGAIASGMDERRVFINRDLSNPELTAKQISDSYNGEMLLVKASHSVNAYRIIEILTKNGRD